MSLLTNQANALSLTIPLVKIDEERRLVIGRAAQEVPDKTNEILDYETGKPAFEAWSKSFEDMSNGLSKGNLRVMHEKTVAGKIVDIQFDDNAKAIDVVAKVVDDNEWKKVLDGCYTGFSVGGGYGRKWKDGNLTRYTPVVRELSLVDNPCIPTARFAELVKADGVVERVQLRGTPRTFGQVWADRPRQPQTFGQLMKAFDESKHPRGQGGKFSRSGAADVSRHMLKPRDVGAMATIGAMAGGLYGGLRHAVRDARVVRGEGGDLKHQIARYLGRRGGRL